MRSIKLFLCAVLLVASGCGMGKSRSPVGSDEELGRTRAEAEEGKPSTYVTQAGDSLRSIASRPEIYGDADLWPLLLDANEGSLGSVSPGKRLQAGLSLDVPRSLSIDELDEAREKARQVAAANKASRPVKRPEAEAEPSAAPAAAKPAAKAAPAAKAPEAKPAQAVPKARSGGMLPILFLLLLVLAALGAVLYVFNKRDKQDQA